MHAKELRLKIQELERNNAMIAERCLGLEESIVLRSNTKHPRHEEAGGYNDNNSSVLYNNSSSSE